ncbi:bifunctional proline dehydrogenase/L-glutamate gamma-semialdehyde dehydrogenase [Corynebacterium lubricantis]|uniref:bifunctional proline dehydrogenase/L-glutamate gamma-semialdehyde dehydrogenase n=1 Tax=Corynebacterium lubricantis TaxID=541095 RepID=UPI0003817F9B|nr:bifunctional proline dehydrogenase/L-glutamate gamma-semialdehyde dehydrogenase [Corynebacterium lubricantis]
MAHSPDHDVEAVVNAAVERAYGWINSTSTADHNDGATQQLAALLRDPAGVNFTMDFVDRVMRPEDDRVAAHALRKTARGVDASFLGRINGLLVGAGAYFGPILPKMVMPLARKRMRQLVGHLVLDAESEALNTVLDKAAASGEQLNLNLLGEAVLGEKEAADRAARTLALIENPRVTYVSVKASSMVAQLNPWDVEGSVERLKERLRPLYRAAARRTPQVFINLDMEEYHDLHLTIELFTQLLNESEFRDLEAGIVLQAYLPDTFAALTRLAEFAKQREEAGGARIKIRLVKGANLSMERMQAEIHGWELAPYHSKEDTDANYYRLLDFVINEEYADALSIGVATHNLFTAALAYELAQRRRVSRMVDSEMLQGMSPSQQEAVRGVFGKQILYTPVVHRDDFDVAVSYLIRRLEENAAPENFLHALFAPSPATPRPGGSGPIGDQEQAFRRAVNRRWEVFAGAHRDQDREANPERAARAPQQDTGMFVNEPDTDPALGPNRDWAKSHLASAPHAVEHEEVREVAIVDKHVALAKEQGAAWAATPAHVRAEVLESVADELAAARGKFVSVMAHEANKTITQSDPEISEAIDFASYYAHSTRLLDGYDAEFVPHRVAVVAPPWNFPVAIPTGGILAALGAGSAVIVKPAPQVVACAETIVDAIHKALDAHGLPRELVQFLPTDEADAGKRLISHEDVDAVILTGASETGALFRSWNPRMRLMAETSGKNALIITPSADPDLAVADLYQSAFGHSGQKCSAASLVIFVGSAGTSQRIRSQLVDAVTTLIPGAGSDIRTTMNGLIEAPGDKLLRGLTRLSPGERWLLEPKKLNDEGTLWSPGIRDGVKPGSWFHLNECFGPVLGIMHASTLEEAVQWQNSTGYGLTGGIHSLDDDEIRYWIDHVEVGNAYVNRGITGAIVQRQPFGGWKKSVLGPGAKAGGPNYVAQMGQWHEPADSHVGGAGASIAPRVTQLLRELTTSLDQESVAWLWRAAALDQAAWDSEFGREHDPTGLRTEANIFRYRPVLSPLKIHVDEHFAPKDVLRQVIAAEVTGAPVEFSAEPESVDAVRDLLHPVGIRVQDRCAVGESDRIRAIGEISAELYLTAVEAGAVVLDQPVIAEGRRELLPYLLEQSVTVSMHRFGIERNVAGIRTA